MTQERAQETRRRILSAAGHLFAEHGYAGTSLSTILSAADVSRGALQHHFPAKVDIADALYAYQRTALQPPDDPVRLQALINLTHSYTTALQTDPMLRGAVRLSTEPGPYMTAAPYQASMDAVRTLLREAAAQGELLPGIDPERSARHIVGSYGGIQMMSQVLSGRADLHDEVTSMWQHLLPALAHPGLLPRLHI
ncbi:hypothetical protein ACM01_14720 [Streptomyces viridochromogenes]|uniref:HTH tetR-type domain-containing protein n=1 Tax=Streptomyces viridochromogenes TaxID=1938 RepID=A0A0J7ZDL6_STRVR|nr:ScbR family autoregulator-binding transcription factor [Streptomyces viridochromogenes]KMS74176.1 hypothetical protein ACM01_14720 [Streptomyces viridochromogenes]